MQFRTKLQIKINVLLKGAEKTMALEEALLLKLFFDAARGLSSGATNLAKVSEEQLKEVHARYGGSGLFKMFFLANANGSGEFDHFFRLIAEELALSRVSSAGEQLELECDNHKLPQNEGLSKFNLNILQPSLSRKLYNSGRHPGYLVYGLGGPKILVSHPFQGIKGEIYDVYNNSIDVVTSLMIRGYEGTLLFLDYLPGLNYEVRGVPAWLVWFSIIAAHSDLVLYIKEYEKGFTPSQRNEIEFTPDRVQKKIVEISHQELSWATAPETGDVDIYITGEKGSTKEDFYKKEREHAEQLIDLYASPGYANDRLFRLDESGNFTEYPLNYPIYGSAM